MNEEWLTHKKPTAISTLSRLSHIAASIAHQNFGETKNYLFVPLFLHSVVFPPTPLFPICLYFRFYLSSFSFISSLFHFYVFLPLPFENIFYFAPFIIPLLFNINFFVTLLPWSKK